MKDKKSPGAQKKPAQQPQVLDDESLKSVVGGGTMFVPGSGTPAAP
jgi:hypothetical protein